MIVDSAIAGCFEKSTFATGRDETLFWMNKIQTLFKGKSEVVDVTTAVKQADVPTPPPCLPSTSPPVVLKKPIELSGDS